MIKNFLDSILQEIITENCPDILESEGKINIERIHRSPPEKDPKRETPRKWPNFRVPRSRRKYCKQLERNNASIVEIQ